MSNSDKNPVFGTAATDNSIPIIKEKLPNSLNESSTQPKELNLVFSMLENNTELFHSTAVNEKVVEINVDSSEPTTAKQHLNQSNTILNASNEETIYPNSTPPNESAMAVNYSMELIKSFEKHDPVGTNLLNISKELWKKTHSNLSEISSDSIERERKPGRSGHKSHRIHNTTNGHIKKNEIPEIERLEKEVKKITSRIPIKTKITRKRTKSPLNIELTLPNIEINEKDDEKSIIDIPNTTEATTANSVNIGTNLDNVTAVATPRRRGWGKGSNPT